MSGGRSVRRREFIGSGLASLAAAALPVPRAAAATVGRVRPGMPGWPTEADWSALNQATNGRLARVAAPALAGADASRLLANPFFIGDQPALTQSSGWLDAWRSSPSAYVVGAESAADVAAAVRFAGARNVRLVVRGGGHSYFGTSNAPDSLLLWTRRMNQVTLHESFVAQGCDAQAAPTRAVSVGAGAIWAHVYDAVTTRRSLFLRAKSTAATTSALLRAATAWTLGLEVHASTQPRVCVRPIPSPRK